MTVDWEISSVACSPRETLEFMIAGKIDSKGALEQYTFDYITGEITLKHTFVNIPGALASITYNKDGHFLYAVGSQQNVVSIFNTDNYENSDIAFTSKTPTSLINKIRINDQENIIALASQKTVYSLSVSDNETLEETVTQEFSSAINSVALSTTGGNLFVIDSNFSGSLKAQCN